MSRTSSGDRTWNASFLYVTVAVLSIFVSRTSAQGLTANVDTSTCGITKNCWKQPSTCSTGKCTFLLTWKIDSNGQSVSFEMEGAVSSQDSWVAFGLSTDKEMGSDSVVDCVYSSQTSSIKVQSSWNDGPSNAVLSTPSVGLVNGSTSIEYVNGHIVCKFQRLISVSGNSKIYPLDSSTYYILVAHGTTSNGLKQRHSVSDRVSSSDQFNFTSTNFSSSSSGSSNDSSLKMIKAHGILMVLAWMIFASFGSLMPRYFKTAWPNTTWCGAKIWFQIHQPCMIITLLLTAAGFIIIFVEAESYVSDLPSPCVAHPPLGIIVMALVLINPIMAIFRCKPDAKFRIIFNIFHFIVGLLALMSAVVTIFLGLYMPQLNLPMWTKGVMAGYIGFHALIECILAVHMHREKCGGPKRTGNKESFEMVTTGSYDTKTTKQSNSDSIFKTVVLAIHLCGVTGCAVAIATQIGISSG